MERIAVAALVACLATTAFAAADPALSAVLEKSGSYVRAYEEDFAHVIASESYVQTLHLEQKDQIRQIESEALSVLALPPDGWMWVRNALKVDGKTIADGAGRLDRLRKGEAITIRQLIGLRDESARFNIGHIYRNFNEPTFALRLFDPDVQRRFRFKNDGGETVAEQRTMKVSFAEQKYPTLVRTHDRDAPLSGTAWIDVSTGAILRTRMMTMIISGAVEGQNGNKPVDRDAALMTTETRALVAVEFEHNAVVDAWVPKTMSEDYGQAMVTPAGRRLAGEHVSCRADYSNFRRFTTTARIVPQ